MSGGRGGGGGLPHQPAAQPRRAVISSPRRIHSPRLFLRYLRARVMCVRAQAAPAGRVRDDRDVHAHGCQCRIRRHAALPRVAAGGRHDLRQDGGAGERRGAGAGAGANAGGPPREPQRRAAAAPNLAQLASYCLACVAWLSSRSWMLLAARAGAERHRGRRGGRRLHPRCRCVVHRSRIAAAVLVARHPRCHASSQIIIMMLPPPAATPTS